MGKNRLQFQKLKVQERNRQYYTERKSEIRKKKNERIAERKNLSRLPNFENNLNHARELLAEMSGFDQWNLGEDVTDEQILSQIKENTINQV